ncbi:hypothetical protein GG344DRAFT_72572 [Lentinula edodes]|nr:hypothetical protein GG344DRAFT_72572 [Lentinula edodes]
MLQYMAKKRGYRGFCTRLGARRTQHAGRVSHKNAEIRCDYKYAIQRADAIRYFVLHHYGGVYLDLDVGCLRPLDPLLVYPVILPKTHEIRSATFNLSYSECALTRLSLSTDWQIFSAGIMTDTSVRDIFISSVTKFASSGMSSQPLTDWYDAASGMPETFRARPVVGGHRNVALLALNSSSIADTGSTNSSPSSSNSNTGYATTNISVVYPLMVVQVLASL